MREFDGAAPVADIRAYVDRLRASARSGDDLVDLLAEQAPIYSGRSAGEAERLRGYLLASFESVGLPASALPFVIEELETGITPYALAAAAKALRGASILPAGIVPLLLDAIDRIRQSDDVVDFDSRTAPASRAPPHTALTELFRTLAWLGPRARAALPPLQAMLARNPPVFSAAVLAEIERTAAALSRHGESTPHACCAEYPIAISSPASAGVDIKDVELQDQDGAVFSFGQFFRGRPSVLTFFYTRCMNPNKCSLTITKLARLQRRVGEEDLDGRINIAAISYDPAFDLPRRLRFYGAERGMIFDDRNRLIRTTGPFEPLRQCFDLGVGYGSSTVNQHRIELIVLDRMMRPRTDFTRMQWHEDDVFTTLKAVFAQSAVRP
jgi:cytochrome oxidase Cu insertion factor (SCO1/SenC/PrrC family)